jgi:hypothetical protein
VNFFTCGSQHVPSAYIFNMRRHRMFMITRNLL